MKARLILRFKFLLYVISFGALIFSLGISQAVETEIIQIEQTRDRGFDYLDIYTTGWTEGRGLLLENKLYIDFPEAKISKNLKILRRKSRRIANIEAYQKDEKTARIVVTLSREIDYDIVNVFGRNKSVVEICDRIDNIYAYQFAWEEKVSRKKAPPLKPHELKPIISEKKLPLAGRTIILDPGHGGDDPGAFTIDGIPEKNLTLQTAQTTAKILQQMGAKVYLTRNEDRRTDLKEIVEFANKTKADLLISIHFNSTENSQISGTETYYYNFLSQKFAETMHETIIRGIKRKDRGLRRVPFYVIKNSEIPSVLLEPIYLSNSEESHLAKCAEFQEELAKDIASGVKEYFRSKFN